MKELLKIARQSIESQFSEKEVKINEDIKKKFGEKGACFVTLTVDGELRGCIGSLQAYQPLWNDVVDNAINAGFGDPRFPELNREEIKKIKIEVSILSKAEKLGIGKEVFDKIDKKMGIILKKGNYSATFLPQVWEELNDKKQFLEQLSLKAGLDEDDWKDSEIWFYRVENVKE